MSIQPPMLEALVYTSFVGAGLKLVTTRGVPWTVRDAFVERVVQRRWDAYNPPDPGHRAVYLLTPGCEHTLLGWLFCEEADEFGRRRVPYFHAYWLAGVLDAVGFDLLAAFLHRGPPEHIDRTRTPSTLAPIAAPDLWSYQPTRPGLALEAACREAALATLARRAEVDLYTSVAGEPPVAELDPGTCARLTTALSVHVGPLAGVLVRRAVARAARITAMSPERRAQQVLQDLAAEVADRAARTAFSQEAETVLKLPRSPL